jgi:hypothetical protein
MGEEAQRFHSVLADKMSVKSSCSYADAKAYIRKRLSFLILRSALIALRGKRKFQKYTPIPIHEADANIACRTL